MTGTESRKLVFGGVALETDDGFAEMDRGKAINAKPGEREPAIAKVGSSESNGQGAGKDPEVSGRNQDRSRIKLSRFVP